MRPCSGFFCMAIARMRERRRVGRVARRRMRVRVKPSRKTMNDVWASRVIQGASEFRRESERKQWQRA